MRCILALDQGTTSSRAILFDESAQPIASCQQEFPQIFPRPGWVEHEAKAIWQSQLAVAQQVLAKAGVLPKEIAAIGITNQRETTLLWNRKTGEAIANAIVWQDRRTADFCSELKRSPAAELVQSKTGLVIDAYFSASKIRWLLDHIAGARGAADRGELAFGTVDTWLLWNLTGGRVFATDPSNASRTLLCNLQGQWDPVLLKLFDIPESILPEIKPTSGLLGETDAKLFGNPVPIAAMAGDQQAALFGQCCFSEGLAKNTYGTGCFMLMNVGQEPAKSQHQLLSTIAWEIHGQLNYALEGSVFVGGAVVQWLRDGLGIIRDAKEIESLAASVADTGGVYLVPAFAGLGAPYWDQYARGTITGLTRATTKAHLARAALEGIAFQVADVLEVMQRDSRAEIRELRVDGGASENDLLLQFQADLLQIPVIRPKITETTALGAASLAGLAVGFWKNESELQSQWHIDHQFEPQMPADQANARRQRWSEALKRARNWDRGESL
jgi:glycerol kinase